jgi:hypothetical protein
VGIHSEDRGLNGHARRKLRPDLTKRGELIPKTHGTLHKTGKTESVKNSERPQVQAKIEDTNYEIPPPDRRPELWFVFATASAPPGVPMAPTFGSSGAERAARSSAPWDLRDAERGALSLLPLALRGGTTRWAASFAPSFALGRRQFLLARTSPAVMGLFPYHCYFRTNAG